MYPKHSSKKKKEKAYNEINSSKKEKKKNIAIQRFQWHTRKQTIFEKGHTRNQTIFENYTNQMLKKLEKLLRSMKNRFPI